MPARLNAVRTGLKPVTFYYSYPDLKNGAIHFENILPNPNLFICCIFKNFTLRVVLIIFLHYEFLRLAGEILLIYILYKLIFDFIIPYISNHKESKNNVGEMHNKMQDQMNTFNQQQTSSSKTTTQEPVKKEDYIDYEEIKE